MKFIYPLILSSGLFLLCSCTLFDAKKTASAPLVQPGKPLSVPVGKNWQIIEEAPKINDGRGRLPFQTEQSVQPEGAKPVAPEDKNRSIEMPR